jgi:hypothetical protein
VNLPAKDKLSPPRYQEILDREIPKVHLPDGRGTARVIAGEFSGSKGPARTFTPMHVWDLSLSSERATDLAVPDGWTTILAVLKGTMRVNGSETIGSAEVALFDRAGAQLCIDQAHDATALLLSGQPIDEPIVGMGPFVMNTAHEIETAIADYRSGKMGHLA